MKQFRLFCVLLLICLTVSNVKGQNAGFAAFQNKNKWGILNQKGEVVIPAQYEYVLLTKSSPCVLYKQNGKYGLLKLTGEIICEAKYDNIIAGKYGFHCAQTGFKWILINDKGVDVFNLNYDQAIPFTAEKNLIQKDIIWYLIDLDKKEKAIGKGNIKSILHDSLFIQNGQTALLLNQSGEVLKKYAFEISLIWAEKKYIFFTKDKLSGIADFSGNIIFAPQFEYAAPIRDFIVIKKNGIAGYIYPDSKLFIETNNEIKGPDFGNFTVYYKKNNFVRIENKGTVLSDDRYDEFIGLNNLYALVKSSKGWNVTDSSMREIFKKKYAQIDILQNGLFVVKQGEKWQLINQHEIPVSKLKFKTPENILPPIFSNGLAVIKCKNKFGVINTNAEIVIKCKYDFIDNFYWY